MKKLLITCLIVMCPVLTAAQGLPVKDGNSSTLVEVNSNGALEVTPGKPSVASYILASVTAYTAIESLLNLEAEAARGFRVTKICINGGNATAAANILWQLFRTTSASSGGTAIAAEATTGNNALAKMDPADANWSGAARTGGTEGTSGAILDSGTVFVPIAATGAGPGTPGMFCKEYGLVDGKQPIIAAGTANGVKLMFTATAGGAGQSAAIHFVAN